MKAKSIKLDMKAIHKALRQYAREDAKLAARRKP